MGKGMRTLARSFVKQPAASERVTIGSFQSKNKQQYVAASLALLVTITLYSVISTKQTSHSVNQPFNQLSEVATEINENMAAAAVETISTNTAEESDSSSSSDVKSNVNSSTTTLKVSSSVSNNAAGQTVNETIVETTVNGQSDTKTYENTSDNGSSSVQMDVSTGSDAQVEIRERRGRITIDVKERKEL